MMFFSRLKLIVIAGVYSCSLQAGLTVIHDSGDTKPLAPFLQILQQAQKVDSQQPASPDEVLNTTGSVYIERLLPIRSPELRPGALTNPILPEGVQKRLAQGFPRPFFLVGSDRLSEQWLSHRRKELIEIGAVGMLVQADTAEEVQRMAAIGRGLTITLGSASDLAKSLGIVHYPVLITSKGLEQ
jgi:integrating conjugative element protein (TIGR03765 family)